MANWRTKYRDLPWVRTPLIFFAPLFLLFLCQTVALQSPAAALAWIDGHTQAVFFTYLLFLGAQLVLLGLTGRLFWAVLATCLPVLTFAIANHLKESVNGTPILASDLSMLGRAGEIAGFLRPGMALGTGTWQALGLALVLLLAAFWFSRPGTPGCWPRRLAGAVLGAALAAACVLAPASAALLDGEEGETQAGRNGRLGLVAGIYSALRESAMEEPDAYSENNMNRILGELRRRRQAEEDGVDGERPNIVFILSESFFDVTRLPGLEFRADPIPNFHALAEAYPAGTFLSNTYAGGTGNVEMEIFTSIPSAFPGAGEDLTSLTDKSAYERAPSLVKALAGQGYETVMVHSYNDGLYNRQITMPALGFDRTVYEEDFPASAARAGGYLSDDALVDELIAQFEAKEGPMFLYGLTMENHQPYYTDKFDAPSGVGYSADALEGDELGVLDALIHGLHDADAALGRLVDYFAGCGEPVLLVFVGDHLPGLYLDGEDTIYSKLGYADTADTEAWDPEELMRMHGTDFLVWNNFGAQLEAPDTVSCTGLAAKILGWAGLRKPLYFTWVDEAMEDMLLYRARLFVAADGTPSYAVAGDALRTVSTYRSIVYDILYGERYIAPALTDYGLEDGP